MRNIATYLGLFGTAGALSICDLCNTGSTGTLTSLVSTAQSSPAQFALTGPIAATANPKIITLHIDGMTCGGCVLGVRKVLSGLKGVSKAEVSYEKQRAVVTYDPDSVTVEQMIAAIRTLGYKAAVSE